MGGSLRRLLGGVLFGLTIFALVVFGGTLVLTTRSASQLRARAAPLMAELSRLDEIRQPLDSLVEEALILDVESREQARALSTVRPSEEAAAVAAQRRIALSPDLRSALARIPSAESEVIVRLRELSAAIEIGDTDRLIAARLDLLDARNRLSEAGRRVILATVREVELLEVELEDDLGVLRGFAVAGGILGMLLAVVIYRLLSRRLLAPISQLERAVEDVRQGALDRRLRPAHDDELGRLAALFNEMTASLGERRAEESTLRARIESDLRRSEDLVREVVAQTRDLVTVLDGEGRILFAGPSWDGLLVAREPLDGRDFVDLVAADQQEVVRSALRMARGRPMRLDLKFERDDGMGTYSFALTPLEGDEGRVLAAGRDMTEAAAEEARLRKSSRLEAVGQLTGGVAHDFNNLLQVIQGNLELVREQCPADQDSLRSLDAVERAAEQAAGLTRSLLSFSRQQTLRAEPMDLTRAAPEAAGLVRRLLPAEVDLIHESAGGALPVFLDRSELTSAIVNLCINARDAISGPGEIRIRVRPEEVTDDDPGGTGLSPGSYAVMEVADTGSGMTAEVRSRALEPFFSTKPVGHGTGLGLSSVYGFAAQSGGAIQIDSTLGHGSRISLYFPLTEAATRSAEASAPATTSQRVSRQRILVVEDEPSVREVVVAMLNEEGFETLQAPDAAAGLAILDSEAGIELVLSDVVLPGELDGAGLGRSVLSRPDPPAVLLISGYPRESLEDRAGIEEVELLPKPFTRVALVQAVDRALKSRTE